MVLLLKVNQKERFAKENIMAKKDNYLEGYAQGLKRGDENLVTGPINKALDEALGNPHESAKRGLDQGYKEMKKAKKLEHENYSKTYNENEIVNPDGSPNEMDLRKSKKAGMPLTPQGKLIFADGMTETDKPRKYFKKAGGTVKMAKGGSVSSASKRADGCATKGKTKGRFV